MWEEQFKKRLIGTLNDLLKGGPFTVIIYNKGIGGHFVVNENEKVIYTHQGKNLYSHWGPIAREALLTIWNNRIEGPILPIEDKTSNSAKLLPEENELIGLWRQARDFVASGNLEQAQLLIQKAHSVLGNAADY